MTFAWFGSESISDRASSARGVLLAFACSPVYSLQNIVSYNFVYSIIWEKFNEIPLSPSNESSKTFLTEKNLRAKSHVVIISSSPRSLNAVRFYARAWFNKTSSYDLSRNNVRHYASPFPPPTHHE